MKCTNLKILPVSPIGTSGSFYHFDSGQNFLRITFSFLNKPRKMTRSINFDMFELKHPHEIL